MKKEYHTILDYISTLVTWLYVTSLVEFIGTLNDGTPFPLASHITPIRNPGMGWNGCPSFRVLKKSYRFWAANSKWSPMRSCNGDTLANCCHFSLPTTQVAPNWAVAMFWDNLRYSFPPPLPLMMTSSSRPRWQNDHKVLYYSYRQSSKRQCQWCQNSRSTYNKAQI